jgi:hypothetical protein
VFNEKPEEIPEFIGDDGYFSTMFDFNETIFGGSEKGWYDSTPITPDDYKKCCFDAQAKVGDMGFLSNIIENHDEPRQPLYPGRRLLHREQENAGGAELSAAGTAFYLSGPGTGDGKCTDCVHRRGG